MDTFYYFIGHAVRERECVFVGDGNEKDIERERERVCVRERKRIRGKFSHKSVPGLKRTPGFIKSDSTPSYQKVTQNIVCAYKAL